MTGGAHSLTCADVTIDLGRHRAVVNVSAVFAPATVTAVVGPNGAGKSTLLRALAGLLPIAGGMISLGDRPHTNWPPAARGRAIAYLPQARTIDWPITVRDAVALGRRPHGVSLDRLGNADRLAIDAALAATETAHLAERTVTALSGGEQARVLMARALAQTAPILIADEPTSGLDPAHQLILADTLTRHARAGGTVVVALHDLSLAARIATSVLILVDGRMVAHATPVEAFTPETLACVFRITARLTAVDQVPLVVTQGVVER